MPGLSCCHSLQLRLTQELSLKLQLQQKLVLAQKLISSLDDFYARNSDAVYELYQLKTFVKLLAKGKFESEEEFKKFLKEKSLANEYRPKFLGNYRLAEKEQLKVNIPKLAKTIGMLVEFWGSDFGKIGKILQFNVLIADSDRQPTALWSGLLKKIRRSYLRNKEVKSNEDIFYLISVLWNMMVASEGQGGTEIVAGIEISKKLLETFDCRESADLLEFISKNCQKETKGLEIIWDKIKDLPTENFYPAGIRFLAESTLQSLRYRSGTANDYPMATFNNILLDRNLVEKLGELKNIPAVMAIPVLTVFKNSAEKAMPVIARLEELADNKDFQRSRDYKRAMFRCLSVFSKIYDPQKALTHLMELAISFKELMRGFKAIEALSMRVGGCDIWKYPFEAKSMEGSVQIATEDAYNAYKIIFGFTEDEIEKLAERDTLLLMQRNGLLEMCFTFAALCRQNDYLKGAELTGTVLRKAMEKHFLSWRYIHEKSGEQLEFLSDISPWKKNLRKSMIFGMSDSVQQKISTIRRLGKTLETCWKDLAGNAFYDNPDIKYQEITNRLRENNLGIEERKKLEREADVIKQDYTYVRTILDIQRIDENNYGFLLNNSYLLDKLAMKIYNEDATEAIRQIKSLIGERDFFTLRHVSLEDSDAPYTLMNIGKIPVQSCQRWNEWTENNKCLPAYVVDANKKVLQVFTQSGKVAARSVVRILPYEYGRKEKETIPLLLIEKPYFAVWTEEMGVAIISWAVSKAEEIGKANGVPVLLAVKDEELKQILEKAAKECKRKLQERNILLNLPKSLNDAEYSDSLGGQLVSGAKINVKVHGIFVGAEEG